MKKLLIQALILILVFTNTVSANTLINPSSINLPNTDVIIGSPTGVGGAHAISGDITLSNTGAVTVTAVGGQSAANIAAATAEVTGNASTNFVFAGPSAGPAAAPSFRLLAPVDVPISVLAPLSESGLGVISMPAANSTTNGYLTSADWNMFSSSSGGGITSLNGDVTGNGPGAATVTITAHAVTNTKLAQMAANTLKGNNTGVLADASDLTVAQVNTMLGALSTALPNGDIFIGNASNIATPRLLSGDASISNVGLVTVNAIGGSSALAVNTATTLVNGNAGTNFVFSGPSSGGAAPATFRLLTASDIPALPYSTNVLPNGQMLIGSAGNLAVAHPISGDANISNTGVVTVTAVGGQSAANIAASVALTQAATSANTPSTLVLRDGSGNFAAGTITANLTGNASGTAANVTGTVAIANGGTGQTTRATGFDGLAPTGSKGDIIVNNGTNNVNLNVGANTFVLTADSAQATGIKWAASGSGGTTVHGLYVAATCSSNPCTITSQGTSAGTAAWVSSVNWTGTGTYTINFSPSFPNNPYCTATDSSGGFARFVGLANVSTTSIDLFIFNGASSGATVNSGFILTCY